MSKTRIYLMGFYTIVSQEIRRFMRIWVQTMLPPMITMSLYFVIFGSFIGRRVGEMSGYDYVEFMAPGLIMMNVVTNSYTNVVSSFYSKRFQRNIEELLVSPVPEFVTLLGFICGGVLRALLVAFLVSLVALFFTEISIAHPFRMLLVVFLSSCLFSLMGFINGLFARNFDDCSIIPTFVLTPLTYLGGVFYSVSLLPEFWEKISYLNPMLYMINAFRFTMLDVSDVPVGISVFLLLAFNVVFGTLAYVLLKRGVGIKD